MYMAFSYDKLWKLLKEKNLKKTDLEKMTGLSRSTMAKLVKGENVNTDVLDRICYVLDCDVQNIAEFKKNNN